MSDTPHQNGGGFFGTIAVLISWVFTYISSFQMVPFVLSCIVSVMGAINYGIIFYEKYKNRK
jgi:hypothetical protein